MFAKKNAIILVLLIEEISLRPELSIPPVSDVRGVPWALGRTDGGGQMEILVSYIWFWKWWLENNIKESQHFTEPPKQLCAHRTKTRKKLWKLLDMKTSFVYLWPNFCIMLWAFLFFSILRSPKSLGNSRHWWLSYSQSLGDKTSNLCPNKSVE